MMALQYLLTIYLVVTGFFSPVMLVVMLALSLFPLVWEMYRRPKPLTARQNTRPPSGRCISWARPSSTTAVSGCGTCSA